jgi:hypothetical protein
MPFMLIDMETGSIGCISYLFTKFLDGIVPNTDTFHHSGALGGIRTLRVNAASTYDRLADKSSHSIDVLISVRDALHRLQNSSIAFEPKLGIQWIPCNSRCRCHVCAT